MDIPGHVDHTFRGQTDHLFRGKPIKHSEACRSAIPRSSRSRICGCRNDLMGTSECIGERGGALDKPRAGRAPLEGGGTHTIGPTEDVHAENERNPTTALSWIEAAPDCPNFLHRTEYRKRMPPAGESGRCDCVKISRCDLFVVQTLTYPQHSFNIHHPST